MLPTSTNVKVAIKSAPPADTDVVAVLIHKQTQPADMKDDVLGKDLAVAVRALIQSGGVTGKSNEVTLQLLEGTKPRRLILIGLGNREQFSCECLREAGGILAKTVRKRKFKSLAVIVPKTPATLPGVPGAAGGRRRRPGAGVHRRRVYAGELQLSRIQGDGGEG